MDTFEEEEEIDILKAQLDIQGLEKKLTMTRKEMDKHMRELGLNV